MRTSKEKQYVKKSNTKTSIPLPASSSRSMRFTKLLPKISGAGDSVPAIDKIPCEILLTIFERMTLKSKIQSRLVTYSWKSLIDKYLVQGRIILTNDNYRAVKDSNLKTHTLQVNSFTLNCCSEPRTISRNRLSKNAKNLIFGFSSRNDSKYAEYNIAMIMSCNPSVETLVFEENSLKYIETLNLRSIVLAKLSCLVIDFSYATEKQVFQDLAKLKLPSLRSIQLSEYWSDFGPERGHGYVGMYLFLANHKTTLQYITLVHPMRNMDITAAPTTLFPADKLETLKKDLSEIKLTSLYLYFVCIEGSGAFTLGGHLLQSQKSLTKLQIAIGGNYFYGLTQIKNALQRNVSTLEYVSILSHEQWGVFVNLSDTLDSISSCRKLESFEVDHFFIPSLPQFPPTIKHLNISGYLIADQILPQIDNSLVALEQLSYTDMSSYSYRTMEDLENFRRIISLPRLQKMRLCKSHLDGDFRRFLVQQREQGITFIETSAEVTFRDNLLPYYEIMTNRSQALPTPNTFQPQLQHGNNNNNGRV